MGNTCDATPPTPAVLFPPYKAISKPPRSKGKQSGYQNYQWPGFSNTLTVFDPKRVGHAPIGQLTVAEAPFACERYFETQASKANKIF